MLFEKYIPGEEKNDAYRALSQMMKDYALGASYADMIRYRLEGHAAHECNDTYYVAHEDGRAAARHWCGWGKHPDAIGNWGNFFTDEAFRGQGIGGRLLRLWWEDFNTGTDLPLCFLCSAGTKELTDLYRRFGFRPAMEGMDHGPLYMPIGDSPDTFRAFCEGYYQPSKTIVHKRASVGYRHEIDCLFRFFMASYDLSFAIGEMPKLEDALLYAPDRAGILFSEDGHAVGWSFDGEMRVHPLYRDAVCLDERES